MPADSIQNNRIRLLIVEDEFLIANQMAKFFVSRGAELAGFAPTVSRAHKIIGSGAPLDAAILDVRLGETDVFEVADRLSAAGTFTLFYTALSPSSFPARFRNALIVEKPESIDRLLAKMMKAYLDLQRRRNLRPSRQGE